MEVRELVAGLVPGGRARAARLGADRRRAWTRCAQALRAPGRRRRRPRAADGLLRLPIDRAFTLRGFGTVVTGTLVVRARSRARRGAGAAARAAAARACAGLQVHGAAGGRGGGRPPRGREPGRRRGGRRGARRRARAAGHAAPDLDAGRRAVAAAGRASRCKDQARVRVHLASAEVLARVRLLGRGELAEPGEPRARPAPAGAAGGGRRAGDRLVAPLVFAGGRPSAGAVVLDPLPRAQAPRDRAGAGRPRGRSAAAAARSHGRGGGAAGIDAAALAARLTVPAGRRCARRCWRRADVVAVGGDPGALPVARRAGRPGPRLRARSWRAFHRDSPLKAAMPREELRAPRLRRARPPAPSSTCSTGSAAARERASGGRRGRAGRATRSGSRPRRQRRARRCWRPRAGRARRASTSPAAARRRATRALVERVRACSSRRARCAGWARRSCTRRALDALKDEVRARWPPGSRLDVAAFKELTGPQPEVRDPAARVPGPRAGDAPIGHRPRGAVHADRHPVARSRVNVGWRPRASPGDTAGAAAHRASGAAARAVRPALRASTFEDGRSRQRVHRRTSTCSAPTSRATTRCRSLRASEPSRCRFGQPGARTARSRVHGRGELAEPAPAAPGAQPAPGLRR